MPTPEGVRFGRVWITTDVSGIIHYDDLVLREDPVKVQAGKPQAAKP